MTDTVLYPYTRADLEPVNPSGVRVGDLLASAGPQGCGRFVGNPVIFCGWAGHDQAVGCDKYLITVRQANWGAEIEYGQPESIPVWRVRKDAAGAGKVLS